MSGGGGVSMMGSRPRMLPLFARTTVGTMATGTAAAAGGGVGGSPLPSPSSSRLVAALWC